MSRIERSMSGRIAAQGQGSSALGGIVGTTRPTCAPGSRSRPSTRAGRPSSPTTTTGPPPRVARSLFLKGLRMNSSAAPSQRDNERILDGWQRRGWGDIYQRYLDDKHDYKRRR